MCEMALSGFEVCEWILLKTTINITTVVLSHPAHRKWAHVWVCLFHLVVNSHQLSEEGQSVPGLKQIKLLGKLHLQSYQHNSGTKLNQTYWHIPGRGRCFIKCVFTIGSICSFWLFPNNTRGHLLSMKLNYLPKMSKSLLICVPETVPKGLYKHSTIDTQSLM